MLEITEAGKADVTTAEFRSWLKTQISNAISAGADSEAIVEQLIPEIGWRLAGRPPEKTATPDEIARFLESHLLHEIKEVLHVAFEELAQENAISANGSRRNPSAN